MALSLVVPAYNEAGRIEPFLKELIGFKKKSGLLQEIIVVDDGSTDRTLQVLNKYKADIRILSYRENRGKGHAVKQGLLVAKGSEVAFIDADGAIPCKEIPKMAKALKEFDVVTGSRALPESVISVRPPLVRRIASFGFNNTVNLLFGVNQPDNLCGFKGMRKEIAGKIAPKMFSKRWVFDVEIFVRAKKEKASIGAIPIEWRYKELSKMKLGLTTVRIFLDLLRLKLAMARA